MFGTEVCYLNYTMTRCWRLVHADTLDLSSHGKQA